MDIRTFNYDDPSLPNLLQKHPKPLVFSPGPKSPMDAKESFRLLEVLWGRAPILGVCLGHQIIGRALGFEIIRAKKPVHGQLQEIFRKSESQLLKNMPASFQAASYNSLVVKPGKDHGSSYVTSANKLGEVMSLECREDTGWPVFGLQFHPESFLMRDQSRAILDSWTGCVEDYYACGPKSDRFSASLASH
jgi:anthranilate synthase/aminodeoxychorismate synthase-like glutamine amidotransferase